MLNSRTDEKRAGAGKERGSVREVRSGWGWCGAGLGALLVVAGPAPWATASTYVVLNTLDSGYGSLRQAMLNANTNLGLDTITFRIPGNGTHNVHIITPRTALPTVTDPVVIDGTTQPGFAGTPVIELTGVSAGSSSSGIRLVTRDSVVRGLVINRFGDSGVRIEGLGGNSVQGNIIGLDATGTLSAPNGGEGIFVSSSSDNVIGGTNASDRNVISSDVDAGIYLYNGGGNLVLGNYIGTTASGQTRAGNSNDGVIVYDSGTNVIGGATAGAANVIAGNVGSGIYLIGPGSSGNVVQGNYLGTDATGSLALSNGVDGITINGAPSNLIGGPNGGEGNVISANGQSGVFISGSTATNNLVQGNRLGGRALGGQALGNHFTGLTIDSANGNVIGGTVAGAGNVISGNSEDGLLVTKSTGVVVQGNRIGVDASGTVALGNVYNGIRLSGANSNVIGGTVSGAGNVISGNAGDGIDLEAGATGNVIQGNYIGTDASGGLVVSNGLAGVLIQTAGNTVGGLGGGARNVISGNVLDGVWLAGTGAASNWVAGNFVGTDATGTRRLGNRRAGVGISLGPGNVIGGASEGAGNVISGNANDGIYVIGSSASGNVIQGNKVGTDVSGLQGVGNGNEGIYVESASTNTLGGISPGSGNLISANFEGVYLTNASWTVVLGNWIGVASDGVSGLGNTEFGVICEVGASHNLIGGTAAGAGNRIGYSQTVYAGVRVRDGATNNAILGNSIFATGGLGIDLGSFGVDPTIPCNAGTSHRANLGQNYPVLTQALSGPFSTRISGVFNSVPNSVFLLEFFADPLPAPSNHGAGQSWLGDKTVLTGADCSMAFTAVLSQPVPAGWVVTATATDAANDTSEFSADIPVLPLPALTLRSASSSGQSGPGQMVLAWTNIAGVVLEETPSLVPPAPWAASTNAPVLTSGNVWTVVVPHLRTNQFYRLRFK